MGDRILLCRRAIEPRLDHWTLPAGFLEIGETPADGAGRETFEETGARVEIGDPFTLITLLHVGQVYLIFRAKLLEKTFGPTKESLEVRLFTEKDIPWNRLAFSSIATTLKLYYQDRTAGAFRLHQRALTKPGQSRSLRGYLEF
jgi:ADP-ribose pyrophosphatase YjhB (NUDIX family)